MFNNCKVLNKQFVCPYKILVLHFVNYFCNKSCFTSTVLLYYKFNILREKIFHTIGKRGQRVLTTKNDATMKNCTINVKPQKLSRIKSIEPLFMSTAHKLHVTLQKSDHWLVICTRWLFITNKFSDDRWMWSLSETEKGDDRILNGQSRKSVGIT